MAALAYDDGLDTALARLLHDGGSVEYESLRLCLDEVRERRSTDPELRLATLLVERRLTTEDVVTDALAQLAEDPTLRSKTLPNTAPEGAEASPPRKLGPYVFVRELARGGMGAVYEVIDEHTGTHYALKTLLPSLGEAAVEELARFRREAEVMGKLNHPRVVRIHAAVLSGESPYLVQDLLSGGTLDDRIQSSGSLDISEAVRVAAELARGLEHSHEQGVLHRDLKPKNILFNDQGEPQLVDFGLAYVSETSERLTETGTLMGTPGYMAPEQAEGGGKVDARTDVYGLGAVLYAMLTGQPPFKGASMFVVLEGVLRDPPEPPRRLRPEVPAWLEEVCLRALAKAPEDRYANVGLLAQALESAPRVGLGRAPRFLIPILLIVISGALLAWISVRDPRVAASKPTPTKAPTPSPTPLTMPTWWDRLPPSRRPTLPLPQGISFGEAREEYTNLKDGSILVWVPPGTFLQGDPEGQKQGLVNTIPTHSVTLSRGFFLGKYEVTWRQYLVFCKETRRDEPTRKLESPLTEEEPVVRVNWHDARAYCDWADLSLPTESQWEYAARGGDEQRTYPWGDEILAPKHGNLLLSESAPRRPVRIGSSPAGESLWGSFDMQGNVTEWVADGWTSYTAEAQTDPMVSEGKKGVGVGRGTNWKSHLRKRARASYRYERRWEDVSDLWGFRVCQRSD